MKEGEIQKQILDYLAARRVLAFRMQVGQANMGGRFVRFGTPGMADILAFPQHCSVPCDKILPPLWVEVKAKTGEQSDLQKSFQDQVEREGHRYIIARSIDDVEKELR